VRSRDIATASLGAAALAVAIFAIGGAPRWAQAVVAGLAALALIPVITSRRGFTRISPLLGLLALAAGLTTLQLVPLPASLLETLQPVGSALRADGAELLAVEPSRSLSLDTAASWRALAFFVTLSGLAFVTLRLSVSERGRYLVCAGVAGLCGLAAIVVGIHQLFDLRELYGVYSLEHADPHLRGPLLNLNHLGGLMALGATISIGLVAYRRQANWLRVVWLAVAAGCGITTVATVSRGATLALIAGTLVALGALVASRLAATTNHRRRRSSFVTSSLPIGVVAACAVVIIVYSNANNVSAQLSRTSFDEISNPRTKFAAWRSGVELIKEAPVLGVGRGAFETSFTRVHPSSGQVTFSHVENEYLQAVIDWGVPGSILLALATCWLVVVAARRWRDGALAAGALGGLVVIGFQSSVDFGVELLGVAAPTVALASTLSYVPVKELEQRALRRARVGRIALVAVLGVAVLLLFTSTTRTLDEDHARIRATGRFSDIRAAIERHPLDYYAFAIAAERLENAKDPRSIRMLNHAMTLHPTHPGLHQAAAMMLLAQGYKTQATIEFGIALRGSPQPALLIAEAVANLTGEEAASAIPTDYHQTQTVVRALVDIGRTEIAITWLDRVLRREPQKAAEACRLLFAMMPRNQQAATVALEHCQTAVDDNTTRLSVAKMLVARQRFGDARRLLGDVEMWYGPIDEKLTAWFMLCDTYGSEGHWDDAKRCMRRLQVASDMPPARRSEVDRRLDDIDVARRRSLGVGSAAPSR